MTKPVVEFSFQETLGSAKHTQQTVDYVTNGLPVCIAQDSQWASAAGDLWEEVPLGIYPYNGNKSVFDRMHILWMLYGTSDNGGDTLPDVQYTLNSGGAWATAVSGAAYPVPTIQQTAFGAGGGQIDSGWAVIDISGISGSTWLGWRLDDGQIAGTGGGAGYAYMEYAVSVFLANSAAPRTPF